jgi:hypothetical protein
MASRNWLCRTKHKACCALLPVWRTNYGTLKDPYDTSPRNHPHQLPYKYLDLRLHDALGYLRTRPGNSSRFSDCLLGPSRKDTLIHILSPTNDLLDSANPLIKRLPIFNSCGISPWAFSLRRDVALGVLAEARRLRRGRTDGSASNLQALMLIFH